MRADDDRERAAACAIAMQLEMDEINAKSLRVQLPTLQIGVGVASGDVVVVGLGTGDQVKYKAVGEPVVHAARIEAHARAGEVWICAETRAALGELANVDDEADLPAAEGDESLRLCRLLGLGGARLISLRTATPD